MSFLSIMSGHDANPISFLKIQLPELSLTPHPLRPIVFALLSLNLDVLGVSSFYLSELNEVINTFCRKVPANDWKNLWTIKMIQQFFSAKETGRIREVRCYELFIISHQSWYKNISSVSFCLLRSWLFFNKSLTIIILLFYIQILFSASFDYRMCCPMITFYKVTLN